MPTMDHTASTDIATDRQADRVSDRYIALFVFLSWITLSASAHIDGIKAASHEPAIQYWFAQLTSHLIIMLVTLIIPVLLNRFPITRETWPQFLAAFGIGFAVFTVVHILAMVALRKLLWPILIGGHYEFGLAEPLN